MHEKENLMTKAHFTKSLLVFRKRYITNLLLQSINDNYKLYYIPQVRQFSTDTYIGREWRVFERSVNRERIIIIHCRITPENPCFMQMFLIESPLKGTIENAIVILIVFKINKIK